MRLNANHGTLDRATSTTGSQVTRTSHLERLEFQNINLVGSWTKMELDEATSEPAPSPLLFSASSAQVNDMDSAIDRTFAIPELLERILLQVSDHHEHTSCACSEFARLFPLQRVSRRFLQTIAGSRCLLHRMILKSINLPDEALLKATLGRLQWFYNDFLVTPVDIKGPCQGAHGWSREHHSIRLHKVSMYQDSGLSSTHPTLLLLQAKNQTHASWRRIGVALGAGTIPIRIRLRIALFWKAPPAFHAPLLRYSVYWWISKDDTFGTLFDRYLDVVGRTMEEHVAACEFYRLAREYRKYQKRTETESPSLV